MGSSLAIQDLAAAIAREEGVNPAYNNPGGISGTGDTGTSFGAGLGIYSSPETGEDALENLLSNAISGNSKYYTPDEPLSDFMTTYTGGNTNAGNTVSNILGVPTSTPISAFGIPANTTQTTSPASSSNPTTSSPTTSNTSTSSSRPLWTYLPGFDDLYNLFNNTGGATTTVAGRSQQEWLVDAVVVIVGIVLIAGAVFGFKTLTTTVVEGVRTGASLVE